MLFVMIGLAIVATIADLFSVCLSAGCSPALSYMLHFLYLLCNNLLPAAFFAYILFFTDMWHKLRENKLFLTGTYLPVALLILMFLINPFFGHLFSVSAAGIYTRGPLFLLMHSISAIYAVYGIISLCTLRHLITQRQFFAMIMVYPISLTGVIIQLLNTSVRTTMFFYTLAILFITMMISRPEEMIDHITGLRKFSAYVDDMRRSFMSGKRFNTILISITNYSMIYGVLDYEGTNGLLRQLSDEIRRINRTLKLHADLYYLGNGRFAVTTERHAEARSDAAACWMNEALRSTFTVNCMNFSLTSQICTVRCPEDIGDFRTLSLFAETLSRRNESDGKVLHAGDLLTRSRFDIMQDLDSIIERALSDGSFTVYYQPIYSVKEKQFRSAEALLRLKDKKYGFISPELFIPAAERSGAIHSIGNFVLEEVCRFIASDEFQKLHLDYIEINLSVAQCMQSGLAQDVLRTLEKYRIPAGRINLEITETAASYAQNVLDENIRVLSEAGISFSLDDYGTGYSNIRRVASLPVQIVKLDKTFTNIEGNPKMLTVLKNTIRMIKEMELEIVVEGVETPEQAKQFSELRCDYIQGYYYSKPVSCEEFIRFLSEKENQTH